MNRVKPPGRSQGSNRSNYSSRGHNKLQSQNVRDEGPVRFPTSKNIGNVTNGSQNVSQTGGNTILSMVAESLSKNNITGGYQYLQPGWFNNSSSSTEYSTNYNNTALQGYGYQATAPPTNTNYGQAQTSFYGVLGDDSTLVGLEQRMAEIQKELDTLNQEEIMEQQQAAARSFTAPTFFQDPATQERRDKELAKMNRILQQQQGRMREERPPSPVRMFPGVHKVRDYQRAPDRAFPEKRRSPISSHSRVLPPARSPPPPRRRAPRRRVSPARRRECSPRRRDDHRESSWKAERSQPRRVSPPPPKRRKISHEETSRHTSVSSSSRRSEKKEERRGHERRRHDSPRRTQHSRSSTTQPRESKEDRRTKENHGAAKEAPKKVIKLDKMESSRMNRAREAISLNGFSQKVANQSTLVDSTKFGEPLTTEENEVSLGDILEEMRLQMPQNSLLLPTSRLAVIEVSRISPRPEKKPSRLFEVCRKVKVAAQ